MHDKAVRAAVCCLALGWIGQGSWAAEGQGAAASQAATPEAAPAAVAAQPGATDYDIGGRQVRIPAPAGYSKVYPDFPPLTGWAESSVAPGNRLVAVYIPEEQAAKARVGTLPDLGRFMRVEVQRLTERVDVTPEAMRVGIDMIKQQQQALLDAMGDIAKDMASRNRGNANVTVAFDQPRFGGVAGEGPDYYAFTLLTNATGQMGQLTTQPIEMITGVSIVRVQDRMVMLGVAQPKLADGDVETAGKALVAWTEEVLAANAAAAPEGAAPPAVPETGS